MARDISVFLSRCNETQKLEAGPCENWQPLNHDGGGRHHRIHQKYLRNFFDIQSGQTSFFRGNGPSWFNEHSLIPPVPSSEQNNDDPDLQGLVS